MGVVIDEVLGRVESGEAPAEPVEDGQQEAPPAREQLRLLIEGLERRSERLRAD